MGGAELLLSRLFFQRRETISMGEAGDSTLGVHAHHAVGAECVACSQSFVRLGAAVPIPYGKGAVLPLLPMGQNQQNQDVQIN